MVFINRQIRIGQGTPETNFTTEIKLKPTDRAKAVGVGDRTSGLNPLCGNFASIAYNLDTADRSREQRNV